MSKVFVTVLLVCVLFHSTAQNMTFTSYGVNEGLAQNTIYDFVQDTSHFLWIGTAGGLCRFDGYQFKTYRQSAKDPNAISSYKEFRFRIDNSGRLWIVSFNGISIYNALTDNFTNIFVYTPKNVVIAENHFFGEDDNFMWIGLCNYGIVKVNKHTLQMFATPLTKTSQPHSNDVAYHGFLEKGKLWVVDNNESARPVFYRYDIQKEKTDTISLSLRNLVNMNDSEALGINDRSAVLINKKTMAHREIPVTENGQEHYAIGLYRTSGNTAVICSAVRGLYYIDTRSGKTTSHVRYLDPSDKKNALFARCLYIDGSGNTWVGTRGEGVVKIQRPFKKFGSYRWNLVKNNNVFALYADDDRIYAGAMMHGLTTFSRKTAAMENYRLNRNLPAVLNTPHAIAPYEKDYLLITAANVRNGGNDVPLLFNKFTGNITPLDAAVQRVFAANSGRGNLRHFIVKDKKGDYITNQGETVLSIHPTGSNHFTAQVIARLHGETLTCGFSDDNGKVWIGTFTGVFRQNDTGWVRVHLPQNREVKSICQDREGNYWLGSNDEIFVLDKHYQLLRRYTEENGLVNGHVYGILCDEDGNTWFSHNKGLSVYRRKEKKFEHFDGSDGLKSIEFNVGAAYKAADGELLFGSIADVTAFYPNEITRNTYAPAVKITNIKVFDEPYQTDTAYWNIHKLVLPYTDNTISFEFALPEFTNPAKNAYQFIMEQVDANWTPAGERHFARYAGLRPGHYTFKVKAANNDGVFGKETVIAIIIVPPFWQSIWFILLCVVTFVFAAIGAGVLIQKNRQKKTIRALEVQHKIQLERERISRDLHDNVGTQLSLISKNIENMVNPLPDTSDAERSRRLASISQTSKEVIFTLRETIWALNREEISLEELSDKLKSFAQKLFELNPSCRLLFTEDMHNEDILLSPSEAIHLFRICQEAIANALKYANASLVEIAIRSTGNRYSISVTDNGIGFEKNKQNDSPHYGLENMKYRSSEIGCDYRIDTAPGKGTSVSITKK